MQMLNRKGVKAAFVQGGAEIRVRGSCKIRLVKVRKEEVVAKVGKQGT